MLQKLLYLALMRANLAYIKVLREEQRRAQEYVDRLNETRDHVMRRENYVGSWGFRRDWFAYEDEYAYNFCGLE